MLFHALMDLEVSVRPTRDSAAVCCPLACCVLPHMRKWMASQHYIVLVENYGLILTTKKTKGFDLLL